RWREALLIVRALRSRPSGWQMRPYGWRTLELPVQTDDHRARFCAAGQYTAFQASPACSNAFGEPPHQFSKVCE
ncbi:hypothetical protein CU663_01095, partial [Pseudomonas syringae pv. actinidifoliorum]|nr:hypothetical protein [Pseudomonas syringae pv. actinidifoliorum]